MTAQPRREFLRNTLALGAATLLANPLSRVLAAPAPQDKLKLGLVTYQWGQNWDVPTVIANCEKAKLFGVELRTQHKHGVEPSIDSARRREVKKLFADSPVTFVGLGTNEMFDSTSPEQVKRSIKNAKAFLQLSHDCGGSGVKVKPNDFHKDVPHEKTIEQIGQSLNVLGAFAADLGQQVRLDVHGSCRELPAIRQMMDIADHPSVAVCWNCNLDSDLRAPGLAYNFELVRCRLGDTMHIHEFKAGYPYREFFDLLKKADYKGWALFECSSPTKNPLVSLIEQRTLFERLMGQTS
jgi:sugar phosphate isomerase/epimerase